MVWRELLALNRDAEGLRIRCPSILIESGFHGAKALTMPFQSAVRPTATDKKEAITIPA